MKHLEGSFHFQAHKEPEQLTKRLETLREVVQQAQHDLAENETHEAESRVELDAMQTKRHEWQARCDAAKDTIDKDIADMKISEYGIEIQRIEHELDLLGKEDEALRETVATTETEILATQAQMKRALN